ncbi:MAG: hypothetical protein HC919_07430 [Oscillatoriales cyanobacterium SM2_2_1]|nr:hypothetical protein [Oscillatoriales cyanobacterium SM2_2_1]
MRDRGLEKLILLSSATLDGLEEYQVQSVLTKNLSNPRVRLSLKRLPVQQMRPLAGAPKGASWLATVGRSEQASYGHILRVQVQPRPQVQVLQEWVSPEGTLPYWQNVLEPELRDGRSQLVVNRSQGIERDYAIYELTETGDRPLKQITLNEGKGLPPRYREGLRLASVGLWPDAQQRLNQLFLELDQKSQPIPFYVQQQYRLIAFHALKSRELVQTTKDDMGQQIVALASIGQWQEALSLAGQSEAHGIQGAIALQRSESALWRRVEVSLAFNSSPEVKRFGAWIMLTRDGWRRAEAWLDQQQARTPEALELLQRLDLKPIALAPQQILGAVTSVAVPDGSWLLAVPELPPGQSWFVVDVDVLRDRQTWRMTPFPDLGDRAPRFVWRTLGLHNNNRLGVMISQAGQRVFGGTLVIHSLSISPSGHIRLLTTGDQQLRTALPQSGMLPLASNGSFLSTPSGEVKYLRDMPPAAQAALISHLYRDLESLGQVSLTPEAFQQLVQNWTVLSLPLNGDDEPDWLLQLDRQRLDVGADRSYPLIFAFRHDGTILYSAIQSREQWLNLLPGAEPRQLLTERAGRFWVQPLR